MIIFSIIVTALNLVLSGLNLCLYLKNRPYSAKELKRANKQWRSNINFEIGRLMREQAQKRFDEKNKTEDGQ